MIMRLRAGTNATRNGTLGAGLLGSGIRRAWVRRVELETGFWRRWNLVDAPRGPAVLSQVYLETSNLLLLVYSSDLNRNLDRC